MTMFIERLTDTLRSLFAIPNMPSVLDWDEWEQWEEESARTHPVRWFLGRTIPRQIDRAWRRFVHEPWCWLKCAVWHRYNVVRVRSLPPTWCDRDRLLLHAAFQVLVDFVEKERPWELYQGALPDGTEFEHSSPLGPTAVYELVLAKYIKFGHDKEDASERAEVWQEIVLLYFWWRVRVTAAEDSDDVLEWPLDEESTDYGRDTEMLCRLAKVRKCLWT